MLPPDDDYHDWIIEHDLKRLTRLALAPWGCLLFVIIVVIVLLKLGVFHS